MRSVLGAEGVKLEQEFDALDSAIKDKNSEISNQESALRQHIGGGMAVSAFVGLQPDLGIDATLEEKRKEVDSLREAAAIVEAGEFQHIALPDAAEAAVITLEAPEADARIQRRTEGMSDLYRRGRQKWIRSGMQYVKQDSCPFCGRSLTGNELVQAYQSFFSEAYGAFKHRIEAFRAEADLRMEESKLLDLQSTLGRNVSAGVYWHQFGVSCPDSPFDELRDAWTNLRSAINCELNKKVAAPLEALLPSTALRTSFARYREALTDCVRIQRSL